MYIKEITRRSRRDFYALYGCEHCDHKHEGSGYDDDNFHQNVIPRMECPSCGKSAGEEYQPLTPKYPQGMVV